MAKGPKAEVVKKVGTLSKGLRYSVDRSLCKLCRRERTPLDKVMFKLAAWKKGRIVKGMEDWSRAKWPVADKKKEETVDAATTTDA